MSPLAPAAPVAPVAPVAPTKVIPDGQLPLALGPKILFVEVLIKKSPFTPSFELSGSDVPFRIVLPAAPVDPLDPVAPVAPVAPIKETPEGQLPPALGPNILLVDVFI